VVSDGEWIYTEVIVRWTEGSLCFVTVLRHLSLSTQTDRIRRRQRERKKTVQQCHVVQTLGTD